MKLIQEEGAYETSGEDGNKHLKQLPKKKIVQIYYIYKNYFPNNWKKAKIIPIHNPGKPYTNLKSYRPISLQPTLGKLLERIINLHLKIIIQENNILIKEQYGFRTQHTREQQISRIVEKANRNFNINHTTSVLLLDLEKAFDSRECSLP